MPFQNYKLLIANRKAALTSLNTKLGGWVRNYTGCRRRVTRKNTYTVSSFKPAITRNPNPLWLFLRRGAETRLMRNALALEITLIIYTVLGVQLGMTKSSWFSRGLILLLLACELRKKIKRDRERGIHKVERLICKENFLDITARRVMKKNLFGI